MKYFSTDAGIKLCNWGHDHSDLGEGFCWITRELSAEQGWGFPSERWRLAHHNHNHATATTQPHEMHPLHCVKSAVHARGWMTWGRLTTNTHSNKPQTRCSRSLPEPIRTLPVLWPHLLWRRETKSQRIDRLRVLQLEEGDGAAWTQNQGFTILQGVQVIPEVEILFDFSHCQLKHLIIKTLVWWFGSPPMSYKSYFMVSQKRGYARILWSMLTSIKMTLYKDG